jgi:hypothetical protein
MIDATKPLIFFSPRFFLLSKTHAKKARKKAAMIDKLRLIV